MNDVPLVSLLLLLLPIFLGLLLLSQYRAFTSNAKRVRGKTLEPREHRFQMEETDFTTVIEYFVNGTRYVVEGGTSNMKWFHRKGRTVWVYYLPSKPEQGRTVGWWEPVVGTAPILLAVYVAFVLFYGRRP